MRGGMEPGIYVHTCKGCGWKFIFTITAVEVKAPSPAIAAGLLKARREPKKASISHRELARLREEFDELKWMLRVHGVFADETRDKADGGDDEAGTERGSGDEGGSSGTGEGAGAEAELLVGRDAGEAEADEEVGEARPGMEDDDRKGEGND